MLPTSGDQGGRVLPRTGKRAQGGWSAPRGGGPPTCQSSIWTGFSSTAKEGPQGLARAPRRGGPLPGKLGGCSLQGGELQRLP